MTKLVQSHLLLSPHVGHESESDVNFQVSREQATDADREQTSLLSVFNFGDDDRSLLQNDNTKKPGTDSCVHYDIGTS